MCCDRCTKKNEALPLINSYGSSESLGTLGVIPENSGCNRYMVMYDLKRIWILR